jgi:hypothetical protein
MVYPRGLAFMHCGTGNSVDCQTFKQITTIIGYNRREAVIGWGSLKKKKGLGASYWKSQSILDPDGDL